MESLLGNTTSEPVVTLPPYPITIRYILAVSLAIVCAVGLFGNGLVMVSVLLSRKLQTKTNIFVFTLAVADFMTCAGMPFSVISFVHEELPFPQALCTIGACMIWVGVGSSNLNLAYIAFNRFILITRSRTAYDNFFCKINVTVMITFAWTFPFLLYIIPVFVLLDGIGYTEYFHVCMTDAFAYLGVLYQIPSSIVIVFCYIKIFRHIRSHSVGLKSHTVKMDTSSSSHSQSNDFNKEGQSRSKVTLVQPPSSPSSPTVFRKSTKSSFAHSISSRQVQVTKNMFFVVCGYYICIMPYTILTIFTDVVDPHVWTIALPFTTSFILLNSCLNFVIYSFNHPQFQLVFRKIVFCKWREIPQPSTLLQNIRSLCRN